MTHWTQTAFVEDPDPFLVDLRARTEAGTGNEEARALLELLADEHDVRPGSVLDVACGVGRHAVPLAEEGLDVRGVDASPRYLELARDRAREAGVDDRTTFEEGDMRDLSGPPADLVTNLWTSFGYFDEETNHSVLDGLCSRVAEGGAVVLELSNREGVLGQFDADTVDRTDDHLLTERREYDPETARMYTEREVFEETANGYDHVGTMEYDVRLYAPVELRRLFRDVGVEDVSLYGGFEGQDLERTSSRLVAVGRP